MTKYLSIVSVSMLMLAFQLKHLCAFFKISGSISCPKSNKLKLFAEPTSPSLLLHAGKMVVCWILLLIRAAEPSGKTAL